MAGRPEKNLDWDRVDKLLKCGSHGTEIAAEFNMCPKTLYRKIEEEFGVNFTEYSSQKKGIGKSAIREKQFDEALNGNSTLLIWLGKVRLGQKEEEKSPTAPNDQQITADTELTRVKYELMELRKKHGYESETDGELLQSEP